MVVIQKLKRTVDPTTLLIHEREEEEEEEEEIDQRLSIVQNSNTSHPVHFLRRQLFRHMSMLKNMSSCMCVYVCVCVDGVVGESSQ